MQTRWTTCARVQFESLPSLSNQFCNVFCNVFLPWLQVLGWERWTFAAGCVKASGSQHFKQHFAASPSEASAAKVANWHCQGIAPWITFWRHCSLSYFRIDRFENIWNRFHRTFGRYQILWRPEGETTWTIGMSWNCNRALLALQEKPMP